jgi:long-chain fatty acid transport protein
MRYHRIAGLLIAAGLLAPGLAGATTGYFAHGYGIKAKGMGGVGIAFPQDSLAAAINPAGMVWVGNRLDGGLEWFRPKREASIVGNAFGPDQTFDGNATQNFLIPEFGYNRMIGSNMSVGVSVFGNGGMNTDYGSNPFGRFGATGNAGVDLAQLFIAPTFSMKITPEHSVGIALNLAYQRFKAYGIQPFDNPLFSSSAGQVTNKGHDDSTGVGVRVGWVGQFTPAFSVGATYQSKTRMSKFDDYRGLFAEQGDFDIPENYGVGVAFKPMAGLTLGADVVRVNYGSVKSVGNPVDCFFQGQCQLGADNGPGFGWANTTIYKIGASFDVTPDLTLRAGYVNLDQPIPANQTLLNILAPGVVEDHLTVGATWKLTSNLELSVSYMHAFEHEVKGVNSIPPGFPPAGFGGGNANLKMYQDSLGIAIGWKM